MKIVDGPDIATVEEMERMNFIVAFENLQADAAATNRKNGFVDDPLMDEFENTWDAFSELCTPEAYAKFKPLFASFRNARVGLKLMLAVGELGETLEAVRKNKGPDDHIPEFSAEEAEVADAVLRLMNYATDRKLRLAEAMWEKNKFNRNRLDHSKEGRAAEHGKRF